LQSVSTTYRPEGVRPPLPELGTNATLKDFLSFAMLNQPTVEAAYYDWAASVERITTARSLPDPQITFQMDIQSVVTSVMPGFMVNFPGAGKLRASAAVASAESQARYFTFQTRALQTAYDVKSTYYQLHFLDEKIRVNRETQGLLRALEQLARAQNEVGKVTLQDVLRAQIEQDRLKTEIANLEDSRATLLEQWKAALGLGIDKPAPALPRIFESTSIDLTSDQLIQKAIAESPQLKAMSADVEAAEAAIVMAHKARNPDYSVGLMADVKMNPFLYRPVATVSLPIWRDKIAAEIAQAQALRGAAAARLSAAQISLAVDFADKSVTLRQAGRNLALLHDDLLPKARQSFEVARIEYLSGKLDFFNLSDAQQTLLRFELDEVEAMTQRELALSELSLLVLGVSPESNRGSSSAMNRPGSTVKTGQGMNGGSGNSGGMK
jgi:outer membrane protein TolC